ncbi:hypothetical protein Tco_1569957 [Tanacetum coccineum]
MEKEVVDLKKDPLHTQVTSLVDSHLDTSCSVIPQEVSNFAPPVIEKFIKESHNEVTLAKVSSQPQSTYEAASTLTEFELKKILLDKMEKSKSYLTAPEHQDCYYGLKKSYALDKDFFILRMIDAETNQLVPKRTKERFYGPDSSYGTKSQPKFTRKSVQSEELVFEVADSDMTQISDRESG